MSKITDYAFLFQNSSGKSAFNPIGSFQLSQLNSSAVQSQLKAAGINTNSKQYKTVISKMMQNANGMMYTNPAAIKNLMKNYDKDGDYISPATGLAGMDATDIPISQRHADRCPHGRQAPCGAVRTADSISTCSVRPIT